MVKTSDAIIKDIKNKQLKPVYFLMGDEVFFIDQIVDTLEHSILADEAKSFDLNIMYGNDSKVEDIISVAKQYPMLGNYNLVIVKEAQHLIRSIEGFCAYMDNPQATTILVIAYKFKTLDKRKKLYKSIEKKGLIFESKKLYENQIPQFIEAIAHKKKVKITEKAKHLLVEFIGDDLSLMVSEITKLKINLAQNEEITDIHIEKYIGVNKEYNVFELIKALGVKNVKKANKICFNFGQNNKDNPMVVTISLLYTFFSELIIVHSLTDKSEANVAKELKKNPFFVKDYITAARNYPLKKLTRIIGYLRQADIQSKGVGATQIKESELYKELLYKILN